MLYILHKKTQFYIFLQLEHVAKIKKICGINIFKISYFNTPTLTKHLFMQYLVTSVLFSRKKSVVLNLLSTLQDITDKSAPKNV